MKGRNPTRAEQEHMDKVRELGCIVCYLKFGQRKNCEIHHIEGKTKEGAHFKVLPLCFEHHRMGSDKEPISRHPYKKRFIEAYGTEQYLLEEVNKQLESIANSDTYLPF